MSPMVHVLSCLSFFVFNIIIDRAGKPKAENNLWFKANISQKYLICTFVGVSKIDFTP